MEQSIETGDIDRGVSSSSSPPETMQDPFSEFKLQINSLDELESLNAILSTALKLSNLNAAISLVQTLAPSSLRPPTHSWLLSQLLEMRYDQSEAPEDLQQAIEHAAAAVAATQPADSYSGRLHHDLASLLFSRYETSNSPTDLEAAITQIEDALAALPHSDPYHLKLLAFLSFRYSTKYQHSEATADITRAISLAQNVVAATPPTDSHFGDRVMTLSALYADHYDATHTLPDLQTAIQLAEQALALPCLYPSDLPRRHTNLAAFLFNRYEHLDTLQDLNVAIRHGEEAVAMTAADDPGRVNIISNLGNFITARYDLLGEARDLQRRNILMSEILLDATEPTTAAELAWIRYRGSGALEDLERAVSQAEMALEGTTEEGGVRVQRVRRLGLFLWGRYQQLAAAEDLQKAIACMEDVVAAGGPERVADIGNLGAFLFRRYEKMEKMEDLDRVVEMMEEAVASTERDDEDWGERVANLGSFQMIRYQKTMVPDDLEKAITNTKAALGASGQDDKHRGDRLGILGLQLHLRFGLNVDLADIEEAIAVFEKALAESPHRVKFELNMAACLHDRHRRLGKLDDLDAAIKWTEEAVADAVDGELMQANVLMQLAARLIMRYERLGAQEDLENALRRTTDALAATPEGHPEIVAPLMNLSICYAKRYHLLQNVEDLVESVNLAESALRAAPGDYPYRALLLLMLGVDLVARYERFGEMADLEEGLKRTGEALEETFKEESGLIDDLACIPYDMGGRFQFDHGETTNDQYHPTRVVALCNLGNFHRMRYESLGELADVELAVKRSEEAVDLTPRNHPNRPMVLSSLCSSLHSRFGRLGDLNDLEQAIKLSDDAITSISVDHPQRPEMFGHHANGLELRYQRLGNIKDLERAIKISSDARPSGVDQELALNMGQRFLARYYRFHAFEDLEKAIQWTEAAIPLTPRGHHRYTETLASLGGMLATRYLRMGTVQDIEQAIKFGEEALELTPAGDAKRVGMLTDLSHSLGARYKNSRDVEDLGRAIKLAQEALDTTPSDHPNRPTTLQNVADLFHTRYKLLKHPEDLEAATDSAEEAAALTQMDYPFRPDMLLTLARALFSQQPRDLDYIIRLFVEAWNCSMAQPTARIEAAYNAALLLASQEKWVESWAIVEKAVELMPQVSPRWLRREDQQYILSDFGDLTADALSIALEAEEDPSRCLRLLELGRGIIIGLTIDCRSDISELREKHELAYNKFNRLRTEIDSPYPSDRRKEAIEEMEETLKYIRQLPGFCLFQLPQSPESLMAMAHDGPVITINSTHIRSDALIVTLSAIKLVELPDLSKEDVESFIPAISKLAKGGPATYPERNKTLLAHLWWLWDTAVEPVLNELGFSDVADEEGVNLPHVWWIGMGTLALAPFHAAGDHSPGSTRNTVSRVVSSYIPTIKALSYARQKKLELLGNPDSRLLLITMPTTPGKKPLKNAELEADEIMAEVQVRTTATKVNRPSAADVLGSLPSYHAIHFACHGVSDSANPSNSHLLLVKPGDSVQSETLDHLTVGAISTVNTQHAQLAYLSACSTARNSPGPLADESLHLAGAFQLAGFSHVLATLWESNDAACRQVARDFYAGLFDGGEGDSGWKVRVAFHRAVGRLRWNYLRQPVKWAAYIHMGA